MGFARAEKVRVQASEKIRKAPFVAPILSQTRLARRLETLRATLRANPKQEILPAG